MKIGIIGAMDVEVAKLKEKMNIVSVETHAGVEYCEGTIGTTEVVVVKCGIGKVRAGMCVQVLCDLYDVTHVINTGIAGSLNNDLDIGDILVSNEAVFHDVDAVGFGYQLGEMPGSGHLYYDADEMLIEKAVEAVGRCSDVKVMRGRVATGDQFICTKEKKEWIKENFHADCCEMEGCAIAEAAVFNDLPFVIIRAISDKADESVAESYEIFEAKAAEHCAGIVFDMIAHMA